MTIIALAGILAALILFRWARTLAMIGIALGVWTLLTAGY